MNFIDFIKKRNLTKYFVMAFIGIALVLVLNRFFIIATLMATSLAISFLIGTYQASKSFGIELVTFTAILTGFAFDPTMGAVVGFILIVTHLIIGQFAAGFYVLWVIPLYTALGFLAGTLGGFDFVTLGVAMTLGINIISIFITAFIFMQNLANYLPYSITNIIFNLILFTQLGPAISSLIA